MATKKTSSAKKSAANKPTVVRPKKTDTTKTHVTTVKAVENKPVVSEAAAKTTKRSPRLSVTSMPPARAVAAEFVGTFLLAAAFVTGQGQPIPVLFAAIGIVIAVGAISGAHLNPAVTFGAWVTRKLDGTRALAYIAAQLIGAFVALGVLTIFVNGAPAVAEGAAGFAQAPAALFSVGALPQDKEWYVLFAELLGTAIFTFAVASVLRGRTEKTARALTYGFGLFAGLFLAGSVASFVGGVSVLNPAAAIAMDAYDLSAWSICVYLLAPLAGGILGFALRNSLDTTEVVALEK